MPTYDKKLLVRSGFTHYIMKHSLIGLSHLFQFLIENAERHLEIKRMASKHGLEVISEFGNPNGVHSMDAKSFSNVASTPESRKDFIGKLLALVEEYQFNGLCLRWESPGCPAVSNLIIFKFFYG